DHRPAVTANGDGGVAAHDTGGVHGAEGGRTAGGIDAMRDLEVEVGAVVLADHRQAVAADGDGVV
ncbi:MAG: hypothetical protein KDI75_09875, partial [Xanthomonadales bacterium]|nr:hypothetical protein [Xanthomonadales bacterium]